MKLRVKVDVDTDTDRFAVWKDGMGWVECDLSAVFAASKELLDAAIAMCDAVEDPPVAIAWDVIQRAAGRLHRAMDPYLPSADDVRGILR